MTGRDRAASAAALRTAAVVLLVWAFGFFGLVSAAHSVHHLLDGEGDAGHCRVAFAAQHVDSNSAALPHVAGPIPTSESAAPITSRTLHPVPTFRPDEGRAPPPILSAA